jgi:hypothetical protein
MQVATATPDVMLTTDAGTASSLPLRTWARRAAIALFVIIGLTATAVILIKMGTFAVYGLPAPFIRRAA